MKKSIAIAITLAVILSFSFSASAYTLSGDIEGGVFLGGITYVIAISLDFTSYPPDMYLGLVIFGIGGYSISNVPEGNYILFAFQDRDNNLTPSVEDYLGFYGGALPQIVEVTGNMGGLDITIAPLPGTTIEGSIAYAGIQTGLTLIEAATDPDFQNVAFYSFLLDSTGNGDYIMFVDPGTYYIRAYIDEDFSFSFTPGEPSGYYGAPGAPQAVNASSSVTGIDFTIFDVTTPDFTVTLEPLNPPIVIPASGGSFSFTATVVNNTSSTQLVDIWTDVVLPNSSVYGPIILRTTQLAAGGQINRTLSQYVPPNAPSGNYAYRAHAGEYPDVIFAEDSFPFEKLVSDYSGAGNLEITGWYLEGWDIEYGSTGIIPEKFISLSASPNPFNPSTEISYSLEAAGRVDIAIYDLRGRQVASLFRGWSPEGDFKLTFDGSGLPSGIYFCSLLTEGKMRTLKLIMMK